MKTEQKTTDTPEHHRNICNKKITNTEDCTATIENMNFLARFVNVPTTIK